MEQDKEITMGHEGRTKIKAGIDKAANAVKPTLGVIGMSAVIEVPGLDPIECDDGVTILKNLHFKDRHENIGLQKLRKAAVRTSEMGGDGTATTTVLTQALVDSAFREIANDSSRIREVRERLGAGLEEVLGKLSELKKEVRESDIEKIATISSLDPDIALMIAEIIKEVGPNGEVTVEKGAELGYSSEVVSGAKFAKGLISPYFISDQEKGECILEKPYIALIDRKVSMGTQIKNIMDEVGKSGNKSILFIADDVDGTALASLIQSSVNVRIFDPVSKNTTQGTFHVAAVRNPYNATPGRDFLNDMAALTGATIMSEEAGMKLDTCGIQHLGMAEKVIVTRDNCKIIGGKGSPEAIKQRLGLLSKEYDETTSVYSKNILKERMAQLGGGFGVIKVGAYTDTDYNAKKYKFDNAIAATLAAMQEGVVPGGGVALAIASFQIKESIFAKALRAPFEQMAKNAGMEGVRLEERDEINTGYDFKTKKKVNMFEAGIIDPYKVIRLALESATAIATSLISYETVITLEDKKDEQK